MQNEELIQLIKEVSASNLTKFQFQEGEVNICIEKERNVVTAPSVVEVSHPAESSTVPDNVEIQEPKGFVVESPLVGTFYESPEENLDAFVQLGQKVEKGQTIGIVEAMKLMNEIEADCDGIVEEIYVTNGQTVEYGQPLFRIA